MPRCRVCKKKKDVDKFYPRQVRKNGLTGECKVCTGLRVKANRMSKAAYYREYDRKRFQEDPRVRARHRRYRETEAGKKSMSKAREKWLEANPEKRKAHNAVKNAVRDGVLDKPGACERCGQKAARIEGHHHDYSQPLDVVWLCRACHVEEHRIAAE